MNRKTIKYPEIYFPDMIEEIMCSKPILPKKPEKPLEPTKPILPQMNDTNKNKNFFGFTSLLCIGLLIFFIYRFEAFSIREVFEVFPILILMVIFTTTMYIGLLKEPSSEDKYKQDLANYNIELKKYNDSLSTYNNELNDYEAEKVEYNKAIEEILSENNLALYRSGRIKKAINKISDRTGFILSQDLVKKGPCENFFYETLKALEVNGWAVYPNTKVPVGDSFYYPDFALVDSNGLCFDIEIDEPYSLIDGNPIHYRVEENNIVYSIDRDRNVFFCKRGWIVIRFSENQIYNDPCSCVNLIISVRNRLCEGIFNNFDFPESLCENKWTKDDAHNMAYKHSRDNYIKSIEDDYYTREYHIH